MSIPRRIRFIASDYKVATGYIEKLNDISAQYAFSKIVVIPDLSVAIEPNALQIVAYFNGNLNLPFLFNKANNYTVEYFDYLVSVERIWFRVYDLLGADITASAINSTILFDLY